MRAEVLVGEDQIAEVMEKYGAGCRRRNRIRRELADASAEGQATLLPDHDGLFEELVVTRGGKRLEVHEIGLAARAAWHKELKNLQVLNSFMDELASLMRRKLGMPAQPIDKSAILFRPFPQRVVATQGGKAKRKAPTAKQPPKKSHAPASGAERAVPEDAGN